MKNYNWFSYKKKKKSHESPELHVLAVEEWLLGTLCHTLAMPLLITPDAYHNLVEKAQMIIHY